MKKTKLLLLSVIAFTGAIAQKLPNKQEASVRIPTNVKIDGKATEWDNKFQAYNISTDFYYTMANSDEELYLVIQTNDRYAFNKIIDRGLTLSVKNPATGKSANITFPVTTYTTKNGRLSSSFGIGGAIVASGKDLEEEIAGYNRILNSRHKFIKVENIDGVDSLISVFNEHGIRVAEHLDNNKVYTLEMAISLKLLELSAKNGTSFSYQLKVNSIEGAPTLGANTTIVMLGGGQPSTEEREKIMAEMNVKVAKMYQGTDFWGEYTLAK